MTILDRLSSVRATAGTFLSNFSIPCLWVAVTAGLLVGTPAFIGAWKLKGRLDRGEIQQAKAEKLKSDLALSDITGQLAANAAQAEAEAARRVREANDTIRQRDDAIALQIARIPAMVARQIQPDMLQLRSALNDPRFACLDLPMPNDALRLLSRPGSEGTVPASGGGDSRTP